MKRLIIASCMIVVAATSLHAQRTDVPALTGPYLGQKSPGLTPEIFAPGIVSKGYYERSVVFSPDQDELFFQLRCLGFTSVIIQMKRNNGAWSDPETAFFSGNPDYSDDAPFIADDGRRLFFHSFRPLSDNEEIREDSDIWLVRKDAGRWGEPVNAGSPLNTVFNEEYPTLSKLNNIYFSSNRNQRQDGDNDIYVSHFSENGFSEPARLDSAVNTAYYEGHPFIAADESYLIFSSDRPGELGQADLYISFKGREGTWSTPIHMGNGINSPFHEAAPYVSPDGKYLFFCSFRPNPQVGKGGRLTYSEIVSLLDGPGNGHGDVYWISTEIIEELRPKE